MTEVAIATFPSQMEAMMWADLLQKEGISCVLVPLNPGAGGWGTAAWLPHELRVLPENAERARQILDAYREDTPRA